MARTFHNLVIAVFFLARPGREFLASSFPSVTAGRSCEILETYISRIPACLKQDKMPDYSSYQCHTLGRGSGMCGPTEVLVIDRDCDYPYAKCIKYRFENGTECPPDRPVMFENNCRGLGWPCDENKKRLEYDIYGEVSCKCSTLMGYVEWTDGECYHEFLRGPCGEGEQLVRRSAPPGQLPTPPICAPHGCSKGEVRWRDGLCYRVIEKAGVNGCEDMYGLATHSGLPNKPAVGPPSQVTQLLTLQCLDIVLFSGGIFENCIYESTEGECLKKVERPKQLMPGDLRTIVLKRFILLNRFNLGRI